MEFDKLMLLKPTQLMYGHMSPQGDEKRQGFYNILDSMTNDIQIKLQAKIKEV